MTRGIAAPRRVSSYPVSLFPRTWLVSIGSRDVSALDMSFSVERKSRGAPGVGTISVRNPAPATISAAREGSFVRLSAGHAGTNALLLSATIRDARVVREGTDRVLVIQGRDIGSRSAENATISRAYPPGTLIETPVRHAVASLGIGEGNLRDVLPLRLRSGASAFAAGYAAHGRASRILSEILAGAGLRWSVQHGALQVMARGRPLPGRGEVLSPETGLVEAPTWDERRRTLTIKALIRPGLEPGARVHVESDEATGDFEIRSSTFTGDTRTPEWYATSALRPL